MKSEVVVSFLPDQPWQRIPDDARFPPPHPWHYNKKLLKICAPMNILPVTATQAVLWSRWINLEFV